MIFLNIAVSVYFVGKNFNTPAGQLNSIKMSCISHRSHETKGSSGQALPHFTFAWTLNHSTSVGTPDPISSGRCAGDGREWQGCGPAAELPCPTLPSPPFTLHPPLPFTPHAQPPLHPPRERSPVPTLMLSVPEGDL